MKMMDAVCHAAGETDSATFGLGPQENVIPTTDLKEIQRTRSEIMAWELLGTVSSTAQVDDTCASFDIFSTSLEAVGLDPGAFKSTLCTGRPMAKLPDLETVKRALAAGRTHVFVVMLWNFSETEAYRQLICGKDEEGVVKVLVCKIRARLGGDLE
jgi:hypothetical protein